MNKILTKKDYDICYKDGEKLKEKIMSNPFKEDSGNLSWTRIQMAINNAAGIGLAFYCLGKKLLTWEAVALIGSFVGVVNITKAIQKKYEAKKQ